MKGQTEEAARSPVSLDDFGDVLTNQDLARLLRVTPDWLRLVRNRAKRNGVAPDLPAAIPSMLPMYRYRKVDVAEWMATGRSSATRSIRRPA